MRGNNEILFKSLICFKIKWAKHFIFLNKKNIFILEINFIQNYHDKNYNIKIKNYQNLGIIYFYFFIRRKNN